MINILGISFPVTNKIYTTQSQIVKDYVVAVKAGLPEAKKYFSK